MEDFNRSKSQSSHAAFSFSPISEVQSSIGFTGFTGEVVASDGTIPKLANSVAVVIVLRDASGSIVYGCSTFISMPEQGQKAPFECLAPNSDLPDYATVEAHALFW